MTLDERLPSPHRPMETDDAYWISLYADYVTGNRLVLLDCCSAAATRLLRFEERRRLSREPLASASDDELAVAIAGDSHVDLVNEQILPPVVDAQLSEPLSDKDLPLSAYPERVVLSYDPSSSPPPAATETGNTRQPEEERSILALYDFPESQQIEVHYDNEVSPLDEIPLLAAIPEEVEEDPLLPLPQQENEEPASQEFFSKLQTQQSTSPPTGHQSKKVRRLMLSSHKQKSPPRGLLKILEDSASQDAGDMGIAKELQEIKDFVQQDTDLFGFL